MADSSEVYREDIEQVRRRFAEYRAVHAVRSRLPEALWAAAAKLARRDGIQATARALDVDRPSLRKWTDRLEPNQSTTVGKPQTQRRSKKNTEPPPAAFLELLAQTTGAATSCLMEVESPRCGKLRLDLKTIRPSELAELIRLFAGHSHATAADANPGSGGSCRFPKGNRLAGRAMPGQAQYRSVFRLPVCVPQQAGGINQGFGVRRPRILVGHQAAIERALSLVAGRRASGGNGSISMNNLIACGCFGCFSFGGLDGVALTKPPLHDFSLGGKYDALPFH